MKKFLLIIILPFVVFPQERFIGELKINLINYGSSFNITFNLAAICARWDENYNLTENYENASDQVNSNSSPPYYGAFDHILNPSNENDTFAVGLYKISAIENGIEQAYFYCDWRTSYWSASLDIVFNYDVGNKHFKNAEQTQIIDKSYQTLWDLTNNQLETDGLEDYWNNCLAVFKSVDNHPKLVWGPYPGYDLDDLNYYIEKNFDSCDPTWYLKDQTYNIFYEDQSELYCTLLPPLYCEASCAVDYQLKAIVNGGKEIDYSNVAIANVSGHPPFKRGMDNSKISKTSDYKLEQNYPNPFNPSTIISYSIKESGLVQLKVYDILGRVVAELINEQKEAGIHTIEFDASELSSGIYFYKIQAGAYTETRKLILQK